MEKPGMDRGKQLFRSGLLVVRNIGLTTIFLTKAQSTQRSQRKTEELINSLYFFVFFVPLCEVFWNEKY